MEIEHYKDHLGVWFVEIKSKNHGELRELEKEHNKLGRRTWMNIYDSTKWMLTVEMKSEKKLCNTDR